MFTEWPLCKDADPFHLVVEMATKIYILYIQLCLEPYPQVQKKDVYFILTELRTTKGRICFAAGLAWSWKNLESSSLALTECGVGQETKKTTQHKILRT